MGDTNSGACPSDQALPASPPEPAGGLSPSGNDPSRNNTRLCTTCGEPCSQGSAAQCRACYEATEGEPLPAAGKVRLPVEIDFITSERVSNRAAELAIALPVFLSGLVNDGLRYRAEAEQRDKATSMLQICAPAPTSLHNAIAGLLEFVPPPRAHWPKRERDNWLLAMQAVTRLLYKDTPASGTEARSDETPQAVQPEGQEPVPSGDAQTTTATPIKGR